MRLAAVSLSIALLGLSACRRGDPDTTNPDLLLPDSDGGVPGSDGGAAGDMAGIPATGNLLLKGIVVTPTGPMQGEVLVDGNLITCVAASCSASAGSATVIDTGGFIFPGMLDAHNHGIFNIFDETDWTPMMTYMNHNQWTNEARYGQVVDAKQYLGGESGSPIDLRCEMDKYAELKSLLAGTTSMLVAPVGGGACMGSLIRTIDISANDLGQDKVQTAIAVPSAAGAQGVCDNFADGSTDAYVIHVAEGLDTSARNEFIGASPTTGLMGRAGGCLISAKTTIVHGTALTMAEFTTMAQNNMRLVWSPKSNMFLYNDTTRIDLAIAAGVTTIALGPDWSLGGSINLLDELRFADDIDASKFSDILTKERLFKMVTIDAAKALGVEALLGSIEVGKRADLFVLPGSGDPYEALLAAKPKDIKLVVVDGRSLSGDTQYQPPGCETIDVCGTNKFICVAEMSTSDKLNQTFADIKTALDAAQAAYDANQLAGQAPISPLAPLFKCN